MRAEGELPIREAQLVKLQAALVDHDRGLVSIDPTIGACWDADRLELGRAGVKVRPDLLSTSTGKRCATA
jgi:uncharacterized protein